MCKELCEPEKESTPVPTNLAIDDALIEEARRAGRHRTKKDAVNSALREYVRRRRQLKILDLIGQIPFDEGYEYKPLRSRKTGR